MTWEYGFVAGSKVSILTMGRQKQRAFSGQFSADNANLKAAITAGQKQAKMSEK